MGEPNSTPGTSKPSPQPSSAVAAGRASMSRVLALGPAIAVSTARCRSPMPRSASAVRSSVGPNSFATAVSRPTSRHASAVAPGSANASTGDRPARAAAEAAEAIRRSSGSDAEPAR